MRKTADSAIVSCSFVHDKPAVGLVFIVCAGPCREVQQSGIRWLA